MLQVAAHVLWRLVISYIMLLRKCFRLLKKLSKEAVVRQFRMDTKKICSKVLPEKCLVDDKKLRGSFK